MCSRRARVVPINYYTLYNYCHCLEIYPVSTVLHSYNDYEYISTREDSHGSLRVKKITEHGKLNTFQQEEH